MSLPAHPEPDQTVWNWILKQSKDGSGQNIPAGSVLSKICFCEKEFFSKWYEHCAQSVFVLRSITQRFRYGAFSLCSAFDHFRIAHVNKESKRMRKEILSSYNSSKLVFVRYQASRIANFVLTPAFFNSLIVRDKVETSITIPGQYLKHTGSPVSC